MNDLSDEAYLEWYKSQPVRSGGPYYEALAWQECRRRAEEKMEERDRKAFEAGFLSRAGKPEFEMVNAWHAYKEQQK